MKAESIFYRILNSFWCKFFFFALCFAIYFTKSDRIFGWTSNEPKTHQPVYSDGAGYYAYLPQWLTYHTRQFEFLKPIEKKYKTTRFQIGLATNKEGKRAINKFYSGSALALVPFYCAAKINAAAVGVVDDGYSWPFLLWLNIGVIFCSVLGGVGLFLLLRKFNIAIWLTYLSVFAVLFGTNLCYYSTVEIPFSHVFCFTVNTWILFFAKRWADENKNKDLYWFTALLGWAFIIRPTNLFIVIVIPFLFSNLKEFIVRLKTLFTINWKNLAIALSLGMVFICFHWWNTFGQSGELNMKTYINEGFDNWAHPEIFNVLFSFKKGLFIYTPIMILFIPALIYCFFRERRIFWMGSLIFLLVTYMTASWWMWWFGGGLGARNYIDFMAVFMLTIALFIQASHWFLKSILVIAGGMATWLYQVFDYQHTHAILHYDKMTYERFMEVFLQEDLRFSWYFERVYDQKPNSMKSLSGPLFFKNVLGSTFNQKEYQLNPNYLEDNPELYQSLKAWHSNNGKVGVKLNAELMILSQASSPSADLYVFKNDAVVETKTAVIGPKIPELNTWTKVELYFNFSKHFTDADSIRIRLEEGRSDIKARKIKASIYSY